MTLDLSRFRDPKLARDLVRAIQAVAPPQGATLMEVCGTHTVSIARAGIRNVLPEGVKLVSGPGCPVCVTANEQIDAIIALARMEQVTMTTFGDMMRVPGSTSSLAAERAAGADVRVVYSPLSALDIAEQNPDREVVFAGVGFETTAPLIAATIQEAERRGISNFSVYCAHKNVPAPLDLLARDEQLGIDAFILPGHVSTIIGAEPYRFLAERYRIPGVITGFEPVDILQGVLMLLKQLREGRAEIEIAYTRGVRPEGNPTAVALMDEVFEPCDVAWRGLGTIPASGFAIRERYAAFDAAKRLSPQVEPTVEPRGCRCGDVLRGLIDPSDCPLFARACTPENPVGPCMVSSEGSCAAWYRYTEHD